MSGFTRVTAEHLEAMAFAHGAVVEFDNEENLASCRIGGTTFFAVIPAAVGGAA